MVIKSIGFILPLLTKRTHKRNLSLGELLQSGSRLPWRWCLSHRRWIQEKEKGGQDENGENKELHAAGDDEQLERQGGSNNRPPPDLPSPSLTLAPLFKSIRKFQI
ncbi:unnamed protein product [Linum trigynum]|uniref:Uncharacterized protein n=1 Tax=Linum trigynum TaxID=586398 RepID=A0AAV2GR76_9ROSI